MGTEEEALHKPSVCDAKHAFKRKIMNRANTSVQQTWRDLEEKYCTDPLFVKQSTLSKNYLIKQN